MTPGWSGSPSAFPLGFTPHRYQRRMPRRELVSRTLTRDYTFDINRTSIGKSTHILRPRVALPSLPRGRRCSRDHRDVRGRRLPPCNGWPLPPRYRSPTRDVRLTRHQQGFRVIHPSGLPLTCSTRSERAPSGFPLSFAPSRYQPRTSGRGRVWNTDPKSRLRHHAEPPINELAHNVRHRVAASGSAAVRAGRVTSARAWVGAVVPP